ncbi:MarR family transcriptional regulator [Nocardioides endophyticus]
MSDRERDPIREARSQWAKHGWGETADGMAMVTSIFRVQQLLMERIDVVLRPLDLSFARYEVLMLLSFSSAGAMPMTRLGSLLQVHPTSASSAVARLERQGFVQRSRPEADRRVVLASITSRGHDVAQLASEGLNRDVFGSPGLGQAETIELTGLLERMRVSAGDVVTEV